MRISILLFLLTANILYAQQKQMALEEAILGPTTTLQRETLNNLNWKNENEFTYVKENILWLESVMSPEKEPVITLNQLNDMLSKSGGNRYSVFPDYSWVNVDRLLLNFSVRYIIINLVTGKIELEINLPTEAENSEFSKNGELTAYTNENNLFVTFADGKRIQVTNDGGNGIVNGKTVHRVEFGIEKGIFISPLGNYVAFYRKDESMVYDYPLVDYTTRQAELKPVKYPMAGLKSHHVKLGVYNIFSGKTVFMETGEPLDHYLTNIAWSPDEKSIYIAELNRKQNHMQMNCYDAASGKRIKTLFEEKNDKYVEPLHPIQFSSKNQNEFYYLTRKDGWFHMYKYNTDGKLLKQITRGEWEVTNILGFDKSEQHVFIEATKESPLERHIYRVNIKNGNIQKISTDTGIHSGMLNPDGGFVLDSWESTENPGKIDLISKNGQLVRNIHTSKNPLEKYELGKNSLVNIKSADEKYDLTGRLILPTNFDPDKKYPVIIYVYGGPHSQLVDRSWQNQARWWQYYMASQGYIAFTMDNRGTNNRGREFETTVHRRLGILESEDQMQGVAFLKSLPFVDKKRIGVHGWSYGGFMTLNLMLRHPETFKVGVAGGPVTDWSMYEVMYGERYMDKPQENPEGYRETNMANHISDLKGKLMLIHGAQDETVVMQHSMKFLRQSVRHQKQVDFFAYPTHPHNIRGKDRVHLMRKVSEYFFENL